MSEPSPVLLVCLGGPGRTALGAGRGYLAALTGIGELRAINAQILAHAGTSTCRYGNSSAFFTTPTSASVLLQKGSKKPPPKPHQINGRISPTRPLMNL